MTRTIILNDTEYSAFEWTESAPTLTANDPAAEKHVRDATLLHDGVSELAPGEVFFRCDQTFAFDTTLSLKGDGRKYVIIASQAGKHVAKPY